MKNFRNDMIDTVTFLMNIRNEKCSLCDNGTGFLGCIPECEQCDWKKYIDIALNSVLNEIKSNNGVNNTPLIKCVNNSSVNDCGKTIITKSRAEEIISDIKDAMSILDTGELNI